MQARDRVRSAARVEARRGGRSPGAPRRGNAPLEDLQRRAGNTAVNALLALAQPKLAVGPAGDRFEREADRVAGEVAGAAGRAPRPDPAGPSRGAGAAAGIEHRTPVRTAGGALDPATRRDLQRALPSGRALSSSVRRPMEDAFGTDFSDVRVHTGAAASGLNERLGARAFTLGSDIFFHGGGPSASRDTGLLAHELTHVVQQRGASEPTIQRFLGMGAKKTPEELAAQAKVKEEKAAAQAKAKEEKAAAKAEKKAQTTQRRTNRAAHKKREQAEKGRIKDERKRGVAGREAAMEKVSFESTRPEDRKAQLDDQAATVKDFHVRFQRKLDEEDKLKRQLLLAHPEQGETVAAIEAYEKVWLSLGPEDQDLWAHRPQRQSAAERLMQDIAKERAEYRSRHEGQKYAEKKLKHGRLLSTKVEPLYEELEDMLAKERAKARSKAGGAGQPLSEAEESKLITRFWQRQDAADKKVAERRPEIGSAVDLKAREEARERLKLKQANIVPDKKTAAMGGSKAGQKGAAHGLHLAAQVEDNLGYFVQGGVAGATVGSMATKSPVIASELSGMVGKATTGSSAGDFLGDTPDHYINSAGSLTLNIGSFFSEIWGALTHLESLSRIFTDQDGQKNLDLWADAVDTAAKGFKASLEGLKAAAQVVQMALPAADAVVGNIVPGLGIATGLANMVSNTAYLTAAGLRLSEVNSGLARARARPQPGNQLDALVLPLIKLQKNYAQDVSKYSINIALDMGTIAADVANLASAGGYGVPAAIKGAIGAVKALHGFSHFIANEFIAYGAKQNRKHWGREHLEGSAESLLSTDDSYAVDAIIVLAKKHKDPVAIKFLESYNVTAEDIETKDTYDLHKKMMKDMGADEDPKWIWDKLKDVGTKVGDIFKRMGRKGDQVVEMYEARGHDPADTNKSVWVSKMWLKAMFSNEKFLRSKHQTEAELGHKLLEGQRDKKERKEMGKPIVARVGDVRISEDPDEKTMAWFAEAVHKASDAELEAAAKDDFHTDEWKLYFAEVLRVRTQEEAKKAQAG